MDERGGLESRCGLRVTVGSNPTPSAASRHKSDAPFGAPSFVLSGGRLVAALPAAASPDRAGVVNARSAARLEELREQRGALAGPDAVHHLDLVVQARIGAQVVDGAAC